MANVKISALPAGSTAAGGDVAMVQGGVTVKLTLETLAYQAANAVAITGGTVTGLTNLTIANAGTLTPATNDGAALGTTALSWADLFIASGGVVNFNNGDVTITHAANTLTFAGATTNGYQFQNGPLRPVANDGVALGTATVSFSDLFLASGGVINWNNGDVVITNPVADALAFSGAASGYSFGGGPIFPSVDDEMSLGQSGQAFADLFLASGGVINWNAGDVTITHSANTLAFAGAATAYTFNGGPLQPSANDGVALGTATVSFADLFLASGGVINWNNGDVTITHASNTLTFAGASSGYNFDAAVKAFSGTAVPAGGTTGTGITMSSTTNLGIFFGSGVPTLVAAQGSLYIRTDGSSTSTRLYVATNGSGGWTNVTTAI